MHLCYVDESGTSDVPGTSSHFVLAGLAIPIADWKKFDAVLASLLQKYDLDGCEIHTAWILRKYIEQSHIADFDKLTRAARKSAVQKYRTGVLLALQKTGKPSHYRQTKKSYKHTSDYIHLTHKERKALILEIANAVSGWSTAKLFAECIDKVHFDPAKSANKTIDVQAFEQLVSRFEQYLEKTGNNDPANYGLIVHDNNETVARKHTELMRSFHKKGTVWTNIKRIIETPLFVDSKLTGMVQIADLCSYALRRFLENGEEELFDLIFSRADRVGNRVLGVRHFSDMRCACKICTAHKAKR